MRSCLSSCAIVLAATGLAADPALECDAGSQIEIGECVGAMEARVDQAVQSALGFARASAQSLDEATERDAAGPALERAQTAWEAYRTRHCEFVGTTYGGGSGTGIAISACRVDLGRARINELMRLAQ